ncbi:glycosyltransferase family 4 protein [Ketobacter sp.]
MSKRIIIVNVHFAPFSFGGATIVAEELALRLQKAHDWAVLVFTVFNDPLAPPYARRRYRAKGLDILAVNYPHNASSKDSYCNPQMETSFVEVFEAFQPDVCHLHSIQNIGAGILAFLADKACKSVVTLHDCWWLCDRQFMIDRDGFYCDQVKINPEVCSYCVENVEKSEARLDYLTEQLKHADLLLAPSEFQRALYIANGYDQTRCVTNKNGINHPEDSYIEKRRQRLATAEKITFGFVGGPGRIKGSDVIVAAFNTIASKDYQLLIVDAAANLGSTWKNGSYWDVPGEVQEVGAYSQDSMDDFFSRIDVLLFPSQWKESFGLVVREALARDVWVIATGEGAVAEDIRDGENGTLLPLTEDSSYLSVAIESLINGDQWKGYRDRYSHNIRSFDEQAIELNQILHSLVS